VATFGNARPPSDKCALYAWLEDFGRVRLSTNFFMREFLHSEIAQTYGLLNVPSDPSLCIEAGRQLCTILLEPLQEAFGRISIRSGYRSPSLNAFGNERGLNCAKNEANFAGHIWDASDSEGRIGATATIVIPVFADFVANGGDWQEMAWWVHDHLDYCSLCFFSNLAAFNITWSDKPQRTIRSYVYPKGLLTKPGLPNHERAAGDRYPGLASLVRNRPLVPPGHATAESEEFARDFRR